MEKKLFKILEKFYKKLFENVIRSEKKLEANSLLLTFVKITSNKTSKLLNESSIKSIVFPLEDLKDLSKKSCIRVSDDKNKLHEYILTAHGIWEVEKVKNGFNEGTILDFIQNKYLSFSDTKKPLDVVDKVVLLSMVGVRTFSEASPMDLNKANFQDNWLSIFKEAYTFLLTRNVVKKNKLRFEKQGNEHPVAYVMRRRNDLPRKTQHLFCFSKNNKQYYLDLAEPEESLKIKLKNILSLIFGKIDNKDLIHDIQKFCETIAYEKSKFVKKDFKYIDSSYDEILRDTLTQLYLE